MESNGIKTQSALDQIVIFQYFRSLLLYFVHICCVLLEGKNLNKRIQKLHHKGDSGMIRNHLVVNCTIILWLNVSGSYKCRNHVICAYNLVKTACLTAVLFS